jgi:hypothetical protein
MKLRPATPADMALLRHWDEQPHVIASNDEDPAIGCIERANGLRATRA